MEEDMQTVGGAKEAKLQPCRLPKLATFLYPEYQETGWWWWWGGGSSGAKWGFKSEPGSV